MSSFSVSVRGERIDIPYRHSHPVPSRWTLLRLSPTQRRILQCLYTRHHDGYVRQQNVGPLLTTALPYVVPYVVQLVGEYVVEIIQLIQTGLAEVGVPGSPHHIAYGRFAADNPAFIALTGQRIVSYWNCYYRRSYPQLADYPGQIVLESLRTAALHYVARPDR